MDTYDAVNVDVVGIHCGVQICMSWPIMCVKHSTVLCLHYFSMQFLGNHSHVIDLLIPRVQTMMKTECVALSLFLH